ncbi:unnamed protein product [Closterium sp. Naga37s-1]|nr:unnamed protein product [Closterium sp. Naga37s-1]
MRRAQLFPVTLNPHALAVALVLAGTAGVATGRVTGREGAGVTWQWGAYRGDARAGLKQQVLAADHASADRASADRASVGNAAAGNAAENTREETAAASSTGGSDRALHRVLAAGSAVEAASPSLPLPSTALPSPLLERPVQPANSLPPGDLSLCLPPNLLSLHPCVPCPISLPNAPQYLTPRFVPGLSPLALLPPQFLLSSSVSAPLSRLFLHTPIPPHPVEQSAGMAGLQQQ